MLRRLLRLAALSCLLLPAAPALGQTAIALNVDGLNRRYLVHLPPDFDPSENLPVMMWFHGGGGNANDGVFEADFRPLANAQRFMLVYPEAWPDVIESCRCWGYDLGQGETNGNYEIDLAYVDAMIDDLSKRYNADRNRVYAGGYSMGGSFVWDLACVRSQKIAAIAPVAASMYRATYDDCEAGLSTAVCHILGTEDFYAPYDGASWVPSVADQNAFWTAKNQTEPEPEVVSLGGGVTRYDWAPAEGCHGFQHFRRQGGGHDVPSFATNAIWEFVSAYELDGLIECDPVEPPANDDCGTAAEILEGETPFSTIGASGSGIPSSLNCSSGNGPQVDTDVWFRFIAPCTGTFTISTCDAGFDSRIDIFDGTGGCPSPGATPYACGDDECGDDASVSSLALEGQVLLVRVGSPDGSVGDGVLQVECEPLNPPNPADLNGDGVVDAADLGLLIAAWGTAKADLDGDGTTDSADIGILLVAWS
ncbi:MAG: PHB depolymerase family esterase [Phycisphaerales bacterium]|nr:PHB depolymerase family esterase [Phycisphaerales bacterium]MDG1978039.1 PHB depolymerase family esterase [Phycisphaerales bacterium]MDG2134196.1 PHB depolymerase family esterase [Phycisphaerales bacterium]